jgi:hypothetical protein
MVAVTKDALYGCETVSLTQRAEVDLGSVWEQDTEENIGT